MKRALLAAVLLSSAAPAFAGVILEKVEGSFTGTVDTGNINVFPVDATTSYNVPLAGKSFTLNFSVQLNQHEGPFDPDYHSGSFLLTLNDVSPTTVNSIYGSVPAYWPGPYEDLSKIEVLDNQLHILIFQPSDRANHNGVLSLTADLVNGRPTNWRGDARGYTQPFQFGVPGGIYDYRTTTTFSSLVGGVSVSGVAGVVPEPTTWALMIAGFGLVGGMLRSGHAAKAKGLAAA